MQGLTVSTEYDIDKLVDVNAFNSLTYNKDDFGNDLRQEDDEPEYNGTIDIKTINQESIVVQL